MRQPGSIVGEDVPLFLVPRQGTQFVHQDVAGGEDRLFLLRSPRGPQGERLVDRQSYAPDRRSRVDILDPDPELGEPAYADGVASQAPVYETETGGEGASSDVEG